MCVRSLSPSPSVCPHRKHGPSGEGALTCNLLAREVAVAIALGYVTCHPNIWTSAHLHYLLVITMNFIDSISKDSYKQHQDKSTGFGLKCILQTSKQ